MLRGKHLIAGAWVGDAQTFAASSGHDFAVGTPTRVDTACTAAEGAFAPYAATTRAIGSAFLNRIAVEIDARGAATTEIGTQETGLPAAHL